jgi:lipoprotein-releasing system ATP-binding protein
MSDLLIARNLGKAYSSGQERLTVLSGLSLSVAAGETVAVVGESGSGKSTLLHLLGGMDQPDSGEVLYAGQAIYAWPPAQLATFRNQRLGFVFQFHHLLPEFTAAENVAFPQLIRRMPIGDALAAARESLREVELLKRADHRPGELSGGEQQRVAIARALAGKPEVLLADEPTGNLDPNTAERIGELLFELRARHGLTILMVTHNYRLAERCDRLKKLESGRLS